MRTVQMTLDEDLVAIVDKISGKLGTTRSAFTRHALKDAIVKFQTRELEKRHREGYRRKAVKKGEFSDWENEQVWIDG